MEFTQYSVQSEVKIKIQRCICVMIEQQQKCMFSSDAEVASLLNTNLLSFLIILKRVRSEADLLV